MTGDGLAKAKQLKPLVVENFLLVLCGDRGRGKTQIATFLAAQIEVNRQSIGWQDHPRARVPRYSCAYDLFNAYRDEFSDVREYRVASKLARAQMESCGLAVIDEISEVTPTDYNRRSLTNLIDTRYREMLPTILITNTPLNSLADEIGRSAYDRCDEMGGIVECNWGSYRR